jgi:hypothetical protein
MTAYNPSEHAAPATATLISRRACAQASAAAMAPHARPLEEELDEAAADWQAAQRAKAAALARPGLEEDKLQKYAIAADDDAFAARLQGSVPTGAVQARCCLQQDAPLARVACAWLPRAKPHFLWNIEQRNC